MTATAPSSPAPARGAGLLRRRDLRLLLTGQATSELGSQVGSIALPLVAVLDLVASPLQVGVPVGADLVRGLALATVPVAGALGRLPLAQLTGPGLGGWLVQLVGAATAVLADAVSFLASAGCLLAIRAAEPRPARPVRRRLRLELAEGLGFVLGQPVLRAITACTALTDLLWAAAASVQLLFLVHQVGLDPAAIGLLVSAGAAGGLGAALAATLTPLPLLVSSLRRRASEVAGGRRQ